MTLEVTAQVAHGVIMSMAVVIWFPLGVFLLRTVKLPPTVFYHALWQCFGLVLLLVGFGLGIWLSDLEGDLTDEGHVILGIVITVLSLLLPIFGWLHHKHFVKERSRNYKGYIHVWLGRVLLVLGLINGGTGLKLADNTTAGSIVYGIVAGVIAVLYLVVRWWSKKQRQIEKENSEPANHFLEMS